MSNADVPIWEKYTLTIEEASKYFRIGENKLRKLAEENLTRIASWRTRRMARRKRDVSDLPYAAPPLSCAAFFVKVQNQELVGSRKHTALGGMPR